MNQEKRWVNYKELKQKVNIKEILDHYGLLASMRQNKDQMTGFCPFHKESKPSFHVSLAKNAFHCFGCKAKGNILNFVHQKESVGIREAGLLISQWFGLGKNTPTAVKDDNALKEKSNGEPMVKEEGNIPLKFELKLDQESPYFEERGLTPETVSHFGLGCCARGLLKGRIAIPIYNQADEIVAYAGRWPGDPPEGEAKYKLPPGFKKHLILFNLHRAIEEAPEKKLIVVEGFFDCFRVWQSGYKNVVALMGSTLSKEQEDLLAGQAKMVILMMDQDEAGRKATQEILPRLARKLFVRIIEMPSEGDQPDGLEKETLISLLKD
jgi:DNA primase